MKSLLLILLIAIGIGGCNPNEDKKEESLGLYKGWTVVERRRIKTMTGSDISLEVKLQKNDSIIAVRTVYYWYDKYLIGDTIK